MFRVSSQLTSIASWFRRPIVWCGIAAVAAVVTGGIVFWHTQRAVKVVVASQSSVPVTGPLIIQFGQVLSAGFTPSIEPHIAGTWVKDQRVVGAAGVVFKPSGRLDAGQTYTLKISGLKRIVTGASLPDYTQTITAQVPAAVANTMPTSGTTGVAIKSALSVKLAEPNRSVRDLQGSLTPAVPLKLTITDDQVFTWEPQTPLAQGVAYSLTIEDKNMSDPAKRRLVTIPFTTVTQPLITKSRTGGFFAPGQTVDITFDQAMEPATDGFVFETGGKGAWADAQTYRFTPDNLKPGTSYHYTIKAGVKSKAGGVTEADRGFDFSTNGAVLASASPGGGDVAVNSQIKISFDQPVDHASAESRFSISPSVNGTFAWSGNTMSYVPAGLAYQTGYNYAVAPGVVPSWGLPSTKTLGGSFTTAIEIIKLSVPAYKGQYWMACELSSLRMLLAYRGIKTDDWGVLMHLKYNPRSRNTSTNTWDDPNKMYVGHVDGRPNSTGYGVHAGPLAQAGRELGRNTQAYFNVNAAFLSGQIHAGNPVAFYSYSDASPRADSWNTYDGGVVQTMYPQHARVIYGVKGSASNPIGFYIHEPMNASSFYWSAAEVMNHMNAIPGVSNQAVVVF